MPQDYQHFTPYTFDHVSARRLSFIISACQNYCRQKPINEIKVIDIGCGASPITRPVAALGFKVLGIDIDPRRINYCKKNNTLPNLSFELKNVYDLDSKNKSDIVICSEVLEHQVTPIRFLRKVEELLSPGGIIIITIPNGYGAYENSERLHKLLKKTKLAPIMTWLKRILISLGLFAEEVPNAEDNCVVSCPHLQFFSLAGFKRSLAAANLTIIEGQNGHFLLDTFPGNILYRINRKLIFLDGQLANLLPSFLVNSWFFVCIKETVGNTPTKQLFLD